MSDQSEIPIEDVKIDDSVVGLDENLNHSLFQIDEIIHAQGESIYKISFDDKNISCSESHCFYEVSTQVFKHAFELKTGDMIKGFDANFEITKIDILQSEPVIGLVLNNNGCYYTNDLLSHSQNTHPSFITNSLKNSDKLTQSAVKNSEPALASIDLGSQINVSKHRTIKAKDLKIGDTIYGACERNKNKDYTITEIKIINNQIAHAIYCDGLCLECSENYSVFSFTDNAFRYPWQLSKGDFIKTINGIKSVEKVLAKDVKPMVSIKLSNGGTLFANGVLSHCDLVDPEYNTDLENPPKNTIFRSLTEDSPASKSLMASGVGSDSLLDSSKARIKANEVSTGDTIYGFNELFERNLYKVQNIIKNQSDCVEIVFTDGTSITISKACPIFSNSRKNFIHAYKLKQDELIKFGSEEKTISNIVEKNNQAVYSIELQDNAGFFSDSALVHNNASAFSHDKSTVVDLSEINKIIKPEMKAMLPLWKYDSHKDWKKAFYLLDFNLAKEDAGYSFGINALSVNASFKIKDHSAEVLMIKINGSNPVMDLKFNGIKLDSEIESFAFGNSTFFFVKLNSLNSTLPDSLFEFKFKSESDCLLTNLNLIKSDQHLAILKYFQG